MWGVSAQLQKLLLNVFAVILMQFTAPHWLTESIDTQLKALSMAFNEHI